MNPIRLTSWCMVWTAASLALAGCGNDAPSAPTAKAKPSAGESKDIRDEAAAKPSTAAPKTEAADKGENAIAESSAQPAEGGWGTLRGKFVYNGQAPVPAAIVATKDAQFCGNQGLVNESVLVGKDGGLANVIVWVTTPDVKIHPGYDAQKGSTVTLGNKDCRFEPHVVAYWTAQPLELKNFDPVAHNFDAGGLRLNTASNDSVPANSTAKKTSVQKAEKLPTEVKCGSHPWMQGWLIVQEHPYMAITAPDGTFEIKNLPTGDLEFQLWHEKAGYVRSAEVDGKPTEWKRGRATLAIKPGDNDLGVVKVPAALFSK